MDSIDKFFTFCASYPPWARVVVLSSFIVAIGTLLFSPRAKAGAEREEHDAQGQVFMRIKRITLYPDDPDARVSLSAYVNGTEYIHPSVAGVKWMKVGPSMSEKIIELPKAERYDVRFMLRVESGDTLTPLSMIHVSQTVTPIKQPPFSEDYRLYIVKDNVREASVGAIVSYGVFSN
jgi:hypothetical protein